MRNRYNQTFKDEAVALALGHNEPIAKIAVDLGIHPDQFVVVKSGRTILRINHRQANTSRGV